MTEFYPRVRDRDDVASLAEVPGPQWEFLNGDRLVTAYPDALESVDETDTLIATASV